MAPSTLAQMFVPRMAINPANPKSDWYGYGLAIRSPGPSGNVRYFHAGGVPGFLAFNEIRPQHELSITVLSNMGTSLYRFDVIVKKIIALAER